MADVTRCKHAETGHEAELPTDALVAFKARGWEPISESRSEQDADQERIDAENAAALPAPIKPRSTPVSRSIVNTAGDAGTTKEK